VRKLVGRVEQLSFNTTTKLHNVFVVFDEECQNDLRAVVYGIIKLKGVS